MNVVVCDIQSKDTAIQSMLWKNLNVIIARHSVPKPIFKGFMKDSTHANLNAIRVIYSRYLC